MNKDTTHFGYETVDVDDKARRVRGVFDSVAGNYDLMNDLMSGGLHRLWKRFTIEQAAVRRGQQVLDLAGGTGDLAKAFAGKVGSSGHVVLADINASMLKEGRKRLTNAGVAGTDKKAALASMLSVLKPGGKAMILEFSEPSAALKPVYDIYSFKVLPFLGKLVASDESSYQYLAESIRMHPDQETLLEMMRDAGFEKCRYHNLAGGIVALHIGYRV
jgi:demethylmenaquinone methyltransferase/2-methoxy-6-polyprenyl-1,4-benzoquinol methylase